MAEERVREMMRVGVRKWRKREMAKIGRVIREEIVNVM
jgi:hypothetical protein